MQFLQLKGNYIPANISTSVPRCFWIDMTLRGHTTSNQPWNIVVYVNVEICNVEQRWNNAVFFNVELNNVRQRWNNFVIFNVDFHNVGQRRNNVADMTIWKKNKPRFKNKIIFLNFKEYVGLIIFLHLFPILTLSCFYMITSSVMKGLREI